MKTVTKAQLLKLNQLQNASPDLFNAVLAGLTAAGGTLGDFWSDFQNLANTYLQYRVITNTPSSTQIPVSTTQQQLAAAGVGVSNVSTYILVGTAALIGVIALAAFIKRKK